MDIHVVPGTEDLITVLTSVGDHPRKVFVLHVFDSTAPVAIHFAAQSAPNGSRSNLRTLFEVTGDHGGAH